MGSKRFIIFTSLFSALLIIALTVLSGCGGGGTASPTPGQPTATGTGSGSKPVIKWIYCTSASSNAIAEVAKRELYQKWADACPNYTLQFENHYGDELFPGQESLEAMASGAIQQAGTISYNYEGFESAFSIFSVPLLWKILDHYKRFFQTPEWKVVEARHEKVGVHILWDTLNWSISIPYFRTKVVTKLEDIQGLRIRAMASPTQAKTIEALGAKPIIVSQSELTMAMSTGMIDGMFGGTGKAYIVMLGYLDFMKTALLYEVNFYPTATGVNAKYWANLPAEVKAAYEKIVVPVYYEKVNSPAVVERWDTFDWLKSKITVTELSAEEMKKWGDKLMPLWDSIDKQVGGGLIQAAIRTREGPGLSPIEEYHKNRPG